MSIKIALAGNPNCGKTTMFNALTGANQYVGNWPGVTVEKKSGKLKRGTSGEDAEIIDLPGIYSLSPYTLEEVVSRDFILKEDPDVVIDLVDATNIERNLYLTTQIIETGIPVVIALNMSDLMEKNGIRIDERKLSQILGCPIVKTSALKNTGLDEVIKKAITAAKEKKTAKVSRIFDADIEDMISNIETELPQSIPESEKRWYAIKFLERDKNILEQYPSLKDCFSRLSDELEKKYDDDAEAVITDQRYRYIQNIIKDCVKKTAGKVSISDKIDGIVTNRILGLPIFALTMFVVYYLSISTVGTMGTDWVNDSFVVAVQDAVTSGLEGIGASAFIISLVVDGIIGGLGAVLGFTPQMAVLFLCLSILVHCGYITHITLVIEKI